ncbi:MAG: AraC family transcriptional regulator [Chitinophagaceae bacterium]|nr:MAG: AraC family transcriptional regulator [Chitinophagaceae bacterium]
MFGDRITNWLRQARLYFFTYSDGFYQLGYLANSPAALVNSFRRMPFVKHDAKRRLIESNNAFLRATIQYAELDEGLWLTYAAAEYKQNISYKPVYDQYLPGRYYVLSYNINVSRSGENTAIMNKLRYSHRSWSFLKPRALELDCHFKHTEGQHLVLFFEEEWFERNLKDRLSSSRHRFLDFFSGPNNAIVWPDGGAEPPGSFVRILEAFRQQRENPSESTVELRDEAHSFLHDFLATYERENLTNQYYEIPRNIRLRILKLEKYLLDQINGKFPGIDQLAQRFQVSPTKLKEDFKLVFGKPVFQYFQEAQMRYAHELLEADPDIRIKELADRLGYENPGKFSLAYKKYYSVLPSVHQKGG